MNLMNRLFRTSQVTRKIVAASLLLASSAAMSASAQVGHQPSKSPYEDYKAGQEMSLFAGYFRSETGAAGVLPKPSVFGGFRYDLPIGGPGFLTARYSLMPSERTVLDPTKPRRTRDLGLESATAHVVDVGLTVALTGKKAWHRLVPSLSVGTGLASDFAKADTGGYKFGTKFAFTGGANIKYLLRNNWAIRAEATNYLWRNSYPDAYFAVASDTTSVLRADVEKKGWKGNWGFSFGVVVPVFR